jgi:hypothetical protein
MNNPAKLQTMLYEGPEEASSLEVRVDEGVPVAVLEHGQWRPVRLTRAPWRIEQYWWREDGEINRTYYRVILEDGSILTIFVNDRTGDWFCQESGPFT